MTIENTPDTAKIVNESVPIHPLAEIFPMLVEEQLWDLADNIATHGLLEPIVRYEGKILDGRCRYRACDMAGVEPRFQEYDGDYPLGVVLGRNLYRRHLNNTQRAMIGARAVTLVLGGNQHSEGLSIGAAAKTLNISPRSIARAKEIFRDGIPELVDEVDRGKRALSSAVAISRQPEAEQRAFLTAGGTESNGRSRRNKNAQVQSVPQKTMVAETSTSGADDLELPAELDRRHLTDANRGFWTGLQAAWDGADEFRRAWSESPTPVRERFIETVLRQPRGVEEVMP